MLEVCPQGRRKATKYIRVKICIPSPIQGLLAQKKIPLSSLSNKPCAICIFFVTHSPRFSGPISKEGEKIHKPRANELYFLIIKSTSKFLLEVSLKFGCDLDCGLRGRDIRLANRVGQRRNTKIMFWMDYIPRYQF